MISFAEFKEGGRKTPQIGKRKNEQEFLTVMVGFSYAVK